MLERGRVMMGAHDFAICAVCGQKEWEPIGIWVWQKACACAVILDESAMTGDSTRVLNRRPSEEPRADPRLDGRSHVRNTDPWWLPLVVGVLAGASLGIAVVLVLIS